MRLQAILVLIWLQALQHWWRGINSVDLSKTKTTSVSSQSQHWDVAVCLVDVTRQAG